MRQLPLGVRIPDRAVFESFLPARNQEAVEQLRRLARGDSAGIVWLCGPGGAGKTHLLQAVIVEASQTMRTAYFPLAELMQLGTEALDGLAQLGCVCLDDVDRVAGQLEWERALFGLYREIDERGGRLVCSAHAPPALIQWSLKDLGSRFTAAAIYQLRVLDEGEQQEALQLRARVRGFELPDETARWLLRRFPRDMRTLYELLDTLDEAALVAQRKLTVPFIRSVLRE
jgi:DnaA-homolog protein